MIRALNLENLRDAFRVELVALNNFVSTITTYPVIRAMRFIPKSDLSKVGLNMYLKDKGSDVKHIVAIHLT